MGIVLRLFDNAYSIADKGMVTLFPWRKHILDFITDFTLERGYAPSVRDLADGCHSSLSSVIQYHLNVLERNAISIVIGESQEASELHG